MVGVYHKHIIYFWGLHDRSQMYDIYLCKDSILVTESCPWQDSAWQVNYHKWYLKDGYAYMQTKDTASDTYRVTDTFELLANRNLIKRKVTSHTNRNIPLINRYDIVYKKISDTPPNADSLKKRNSSNTPPHF
jgi:hypothetical protein